jgi:hypothetical protein
MSDQWNKEKCCIERAMHGVSDDACADVITLSETGALSSSAPLLQQKRSVADKY